MHSVQGSNKENAEWQCMQCNSQTLSWWGGITTLQNRNIQGETELLRRLWKHNLGTKSDNDHHLFGLGIGSNTLLGRSR